MSRIGTNAGSITLVIATPMTSSIARLARPRPTPCMLAKNAPGKAYSTPARRVGSTNENVCYYRDEQVRTPVVVAAAVARPSAVCHVSMISKRPASRDDGADLRLAVLAEHRHAVSVATRTTPQDDVTSGAAAAELPSTCHPKPSSTGTARPAGNTPAGGDVVGSVHGCGGHRVVEPGRQESGIQPIMTHHPTLGCTPATATRSTPLAAATASPDRPRRRHRQSERTSRLQRRHQVRWPAAARHGDLVATPSRTLRQQRLDPTCSISSGPRPCPVHPSTKSALRIADVLRRWPCAAATPPAVVRPSSCLQRSLHLHADLQASALAICHRGPHDDPGPRPAAAIEQAIARSRRRRQRRRPRRLPDDAVFEFRSPASAFEGLANLRGVARQPRHVRIDLRRISGSGNVSSARADGQLPTASSPMISGSPCSSSGATGHHRSASTSPSPGRRRPGRRIARGHDDRLQRPHRCAGHTRAGPTPRRIP